MRIIKNSKLLEFCERYPEAEQSLLSWAADIKKLNLESLNDINRYYKAKVLGNNRVIFRIKGNNFRLITIVMIKADRVYLRWFGTHADYDKIDAHTI
jgi:mRNA interferase HigB